MIPVGSLEYAQARMQARIGRRPGEAVWTAIEHAREAEALIDLARDTSLQAPLAQLGSRRSIHAVEAVLRAYWRGVVAEVALWMPQAWRPALQWCGVLPELPWLRHWAEGRRPADWMRAEPRYRELLDADRRSIPSGHEFAPLAAALAQPALLAQAWGDEWLRRLPPAARQAVARQAVTRLIGDYMSRSVVVAGPDGLRLRRVFDARLLASFRRHAIEPMAAFAYLGLMALDLDRLRGELVLRLALPARSFAS
ncbi:MAG: hypothetical protein RR101_10545 [Burkholderiaceae bacterium]